MEKDGARERLLETGRHHEWPSALVLRTFLSRYPELVRGRRVLELGSGLGTCGVAAAEAGAAEVVFTDAEEAHPVLARLRRTAEDLCRKLGPGGNDAEEGDGSGVQSRRERYQVRGFTWGLLPSYLLPPNPAPQVLLAADCLYDSTQFEDFVASVGYLLHRDPASMLLMTYHIRRNIGSLLRRYRLMACLVPLESFMSFDEIGGLDANVELSIIQASMTQLDDSSSKRLQCTKAGEASSKHPPVP